MVNQSTGVFPAFVVMRVYEHRAARLSYFSGESQV